jgi:putative transposase
MPRFKRVVAIGAPHHITQRGNDRQDVFIDDSVRRTYLDLLAEHAGKNDLKVLAYCLMTNHVHLVVVPESEDSMANTFRHAHSRFAQYWNTECGRSGHLWQNRFYSCPVEECAAWRVIQYVEQNPVRAGVAEHAAAYAWSSARAHLGLESPPLLDLDWWRQRWTPDAWAETLGPAVADIDAIRNATYNGRPYGSAIFTGHLERQLSRQLVRGKGGRPRKLPVRSHPEQMLMWAAGF